MSQDKEDREVSIWDIGLVAVSAAYILVLLLAIPWTYYYKNVLFWEDGTGIALILAVLAVLNCISLIFRLRIIDLNELRWKDFSEYHVSMAISSFANIFFWLGIAMWFVFQELSLNRLLCFLVAIMGALGHTVLHFLRWRMKKSTSATLLLAVYSTIAVGLTWAFFSGANFQ